MPNTDRSTLNARVAGLGAVAGLRSMLPFALLAAAANRVDGFADGPFATDAAPPVGLLRSRWALLGLGLAAAGELVGDKLPFTPDRIAPGPLGGRLVLGALAGAALYQEARRPPLTGAALGAVAAGGGAAAGFFARRGLGRVTGIPDPVLALLEDALAIGLGLRAVRGRRREG